MIFIRLIISSGYKLIAAECRVWVILSCKLFCKQNNAQSVKCVRAGFNTK